MTNKLAAALGLWGILAAPVAHSTELDMQSIFSELIPVLGTSGKEFTETVALLSGNDLRINFRNPGEIVNENGIWDAVSTGAVEAGWYSLGFAEGIVPSSPLFASFPFGPDVRAYTAWWYHGGGKELWAEIGGKHDVHAVLCGVLVPEGSGWFREEITSIEQFDGLKIRMFGLGAAVLQELGAAAQSLSGSDTAAALNLGTIDAAEIAFPAIDYAVGMQTFADYYYFPGWHQQTSLTMFIVNQGVWDGLEVRERAIIDEVCTATVTKTMALGEAIQVEPLQKLREGGTNINVWPDEMLDAFEAAWMRVVEAKTAADPDFARTWQSLEDFRAGYKQWSDLGYLKER